MREAYNGFDTPNVCYEGLREQDLGEVREGLEPSVAENGFYRCLKSASERAASIAPSGTVI